MKIYFYAYEYDIKKDGTVDSKNIQAASWDVSKGENMTRAVIIGIGEIEPKLFDYDQVQMRRIETAEKKLDDYRAESTARITAMLAHINELKALEAPK